MRLPRGHAFGLKAVTHPGLGQNIGRGSGIRFDFLPELTNEHTQVFRLLSAGCAPYGREQLAMRDNFVWTTGKIDEQFKFFWRQLQFAATDEDCMCVEIDAEIAIFDHPSTNFFLRSTPQVRADACEEFIYAKRFSHVVVGSGVER